LVKYAAIQNDGDRIAFNERLVLFGRSLGRYLQQIAEFEIFATEEMPFPFNDWPSVY